MTHSFIRTSALCLSMACALSSTSFDYAEAKGNYLPDSPYANRSAKQGASISQPLYPERVQTGSFVPQQLEPIPVAPTFNEPLAEPLFNAAPLINTAPQPILMPSAPLYPSRIAAPSSSVPSTLEPMQAPTTQPAPIPIATPVPIAAPIMAAPAPISVPITVPIAAPASNKVQLPLPSDMPTFTPYATLETQKEIPIDPSVHNIPMPLPTPAPAHNIAAPAPQPAITPLPALDEMHVPVAPAPRTVAAPIIEPAAPAPKLSKESKNILAKLPDNIDAPKPDTKKKVTIQRFDPDIEGILNAGKGAADDVKTHESAGVRIQVSRPAFNAEYELEKAYNALISGQTEFAIEIYKDILKQAPYNEPALFGLATTYHRIGNLDVARPLYGKLLGINPEHREALNNFLALVSEESPEEGLRQLERLEAKNPDFSPIPAQMALLLDRMGSPEAARKKMIRAMSLSPDNLAYKYNLAILMDRQGQYSNAAELYRQLIKAGDRGEILPTNSSELQERLTFIVSNKL